MILLDADVLLIDIRYPTDTRFAVNRRTLERLRDDGRASGITSQALLEVVGVLSFNVSESRISQLAALLPVQYGLLVIPDPGGHSEYAGCSVSEVVERMRRRMALGDAVQIAQMEKYAPTAECLLSWNARHFIGKSVVPTLTPEEWLAAQDSPAT